MMAQNDLMLESAGDEDLPAIVALVNMSYRGETARAGWAHEADYIDGERVTLASLRADLAASPDARLLIHRDTSNAPLLGCAWLEPKEDGIWYVGLLTVRPDLQDRQLGRRLLAAAEDRARAAGARMMRLTVVSLRETLIAWYERRGYRLTGEVRPFPPVEPPRPDLRLVVLEKTL